MRSIKVIAERGDGNGKEQKTDCVQAYVELGGIEIMYADSDKVIARDNYGTPRRAHGAKVRYNAKGEPYFKHNGRREYLRDYLRCN